MRTATLAILKVTLGLVSVALICLAFAVIWSISTFLSILLLIVLVLFGLGCLGELVWKTLVRRKEEPDVNVPSRQN